MKRVLYRITAGLAIGFFVFQLNPMTLACGEDSPAKHKERSVSPSPLSDGAPYTMRDFLNADTLAEINTHTISQQTSSYARDGSNNDSLFMQGDDKTTKNRELMSAQTPGAVTRMWFTGNAEARLKFYFNGETTPRIDMTVAELTEGKQSPFLFPLVGNDAVSSGGYYCYLPILFDKSLVIKGDGVQYYNINFCTFKSGTRLETFSGAEDVGAMADIWKKAGSDPKSFTDNQPFSKTVDLPEAQTADWELYSGEAGIASLKLRIPDVGQHPLYGMESHSGRAHKGYSEFTMTIDPNNQGVVLRKLIDYGVADQKVKIYADGSYVGEWFAQGASNTVRWAELDYTIPASFTQGKSSVTIRSEFVSSQIDINEFRYQTFSLIDGARVPSDTLDVLDDASERAHSYTITNQQWSGTPAFMGEILDPAAGEPAKKTKQILNGVFLRLYFDGESKPSVDAPLGSFFAVGSYGYGMDTNGLLVGFNQDGVLYCYYPMPFHKSAKIELVNNTGFDLARIQADWSVNRRLKLTDSNGYFKTQYRDIVAEAGKYMVALEEKAGHGRMVGITQSALGHIGQWYLEGDEMFYVDGSREHAGHGTGTEDIYNGAWYFAGGIFSQPLHGYTAMSVDFNNKTASSAMYRTYLADSIVFRNGMQYVLEHGGGNDATGSRHQILTYYYYRDNNVLMQQDTLHVGDAEQRTAHSYQSDGSAFTAGGVFQAYYKNTTATLNGMATRNTSSMVFQIDPDNNGLMIKRLFQHELRGIAGVTVDNQPAGVWTTNFIGGVNDTYSALGEDFFLIPASLTKGKTQITVSFTNMGGSIPWKEAAYTVYAFTDSDKETPPPVDTDKDPETPPPSADTGKDPETPDKDTEMPSNVKTGVTSWALWAAVCAVSSLALGLVCLIRRKTRKRG